MDKFNFKLYIRVVLTNQGFAYEESVRCLTMKEFEGLCEKLAANVSDEEKMMIGLETLRTIFNVSLLNVIQKMEAEHQKDGSVFGVSWAFLDYIHNNFDLPVPHLLFDCEDDCILDDQSEYEESRDKTISFLEAGEVEEKAMSVERYVACLAITPPEYDESSLRLHSFPNIIMLDFFKRAIINNCNCSWLNTEDSSSLNAFIHETKLTVDKSKAVADANHVNEYEEPEDMISYISHELNDGRSHESIYSLIVTFLEIMCPEMTLELTHGNGVDVYSDRTVTSGTIDTLVQAVMSEKFKRIVQMELDDCESALFSCIDGHFI